MSGYLLRKLGHFTRFSRDDREALEDVVGATRSYLARQDLICEGDNSDHVNLVLKGWVCRYKQLEDGRRQITSFLLPGDLCEPHVYILQEMDHSIGTLTAATVAEIPRAKLEAITADRPRIERALWWDMLVTASIQREWTVNVGQRTAQERVGHLFCELYCRLLAVGLASEKGFAFPVT